LLGYLSRNNDKLEKFASEPNCYYNMNIDIEYNPEKNQKNIKERGISFDTANNFEWDTA